MQFICLFSLFLIVAKGKPRLSVTSLHNAEVKQELFTALKRLTCYYQHAFRNINLDALFGVKIAQGKLCHFNELFY